MHVATATACEMVGPRGPVVADNATLGLVLFGGGCSYPSHAHSGITESYVCLSGSVSENNYDIYTSPVSLDAKIRLNQDAEKSGHD